MFIYVIVNSETLKIYIGQHKGGSLTQYLQRKFSAAAHYEAGGSRLFAEMRKYSRNSWHIYPLVSGIESRQELHELERHYIRVLNVQHLEVGYNVYPGGKGGQTPGQISDEIHRKMSEAAKLRFSNPEERAKHSACHKGKPMPPRTEAHRKHLSESLMGHKPSAEQLLHQSLAQKGKPK